LEKFTTAGKGYISTASTGSLSGIAPENI